jgi:hypothetical protein
MTTILLHNLLGACVQDNLFWFVISLLCDDVINKVTTFVPLQIVAMSKDE